MKQFPEDEPHASDEAGTDNANQISDDRRRIMARLTAMSFSVPLVLASLNRSAAAAS
jgi:hypothetical protein